MKYDETTTQQIIIDYQKGLTAAEIATALTLSLKNYKFQEDVKAGLPLERCGGNSEEVPERSVIAKLSSLGVYKKKTYTNKRGDVPVKKEEYIDRIAHLLEVNSDILESLEKVNKAVLALIAERLSTTPTEEF